MVYKKNQKINIVIIATRMSAVKHFMQNHIKELSKNANIIIVVQNNLGYNFSLENVQIHNIKIARKISLLNDILSVISFNKIVRKYYYNNAIIVSLTPKAGLISSFIYKKAIIKNIHYFTGQVWETKKGFIRFLLKSIDKFIVLRKTHILADSFSQKDFLLKEHICKKHDIKVLGSGSICGVVFNQDNKYTSFSDKELLNRKNILFCGRINIDKGIKKFVDIAYALKNKFNFLVIGPNEMNYDFPSYINYLGYVENPDNYYAICKYLVIPTIREGFGQVFIEAQANMCLPISHNINGVKDSVINNVTGVLLNIDSTSSDFVEVIKKLEESPEKYLELVRKGFEVTKSNFESRIVTSNFVKYIMEDIK